MNEFRTTMLYVIAVAIITFAASAYFTFLYE